ncbi:MAG: hypothetical protein QOI59_26 [Gammaproteobacteria bacterium]|nr:hypothetical protein [Gammaproteobacteria bacterium]
MARAVTLTTTLSAPFGIVLALGLASSVHAGEYTKSYSVAGRAEVHVHVDDSSVRIVTSDTHQVDFNVKDEGSAAGLILGGKLKIDSQQNGNLVELTVLRNPGVTIGFNDKELSTEVHMPRDADLQIHTRDGRIDVSSVNGAITLHTTDGAIKASQLTGRIEIRSVDGAISLAQADGSCEVSSTDGSIRVGGRFDALDIKTTDGSVVAKAEQGSKMSGAWNIRTVDGGIELALPHDFQANVDARTRDGHISLALPVTVQGNIGKSEVHGTLNGGGPELTLRSTDGSIRLNGI